MAFKKYIKIERILMVLAALGLMSGIHLVMKDRRQPPVAQPIMAPSFAPYKNYIAASGIVEAKGRNVSIGALISGVVDDIMVNAEDFVKKGAPLFSLDQRQALADLSIKESAFHLAEENVHQAQVDLTSKKHLNDIIQRVSDKTAVSKEDIITRADNMALAASSLKVSKAALKNAEDNLAAAKTNLELLTICAPTDGQVLRININKGEFVTAVTATGNPPILFGDGHHYQIRVEIDENDAWRFKKGTNAIAYLRGNTAIKIPITYSYTEPYIVPKTQLTGNPQERVDVRVLQVLYTYDPKDFSSYIGQQLDIYIEVPA